MDQIIQLISNVGFPIACCLILFRQTDKLTATLNEISTTMSLMKNEINDIKDQLNKGVKCTDVTSNV